MLFVCSNHPLFPPPVSGLYWNTSYRGLSPSAHIIHYETNRLSRVTEDYTSDTLDAVTSYTYDKAGNRLTESVTKSGTATLTNYAYNELNRLLTTTIQNGGTKETTRYSYDNNGNKTGKTYEKTMQIDPAATPAPHFGLYISGQGATEYAAPIAQNVAYYEYAMKIDSANAGYAAICKAVGILPVKPGERYDDSKTVTFGEAAAALYKALAYIK